jgi:hypothetical protein
MCSLLLKPDGRSDQKNNQHYSKSANDINGLDMRDEEPCPFPILYDGFEDESNDYNESTYPESRLHPFK